MEFLKNKLVCRLAPIRSPFVWAAGAGAAPAGPAGEQTPDAEAEEKKRRRQRQMDIVRAQLPAEIKQLMRESLQSDSFERQVLVDQVLSKDMTPEQFKESLDKLDTEEEVANKSWNTIFKKQTAVRTKIQNLYYQVQDYRELIPHQRKKFDELLGDVMFLNTRDTSTDTNLKKELYALTQADPAKGLTQVIDQKKANEIYLLDPRSTNFWREMGTLKGILAGAPQRNGTRIFRKIIALKEEERKAEEEFERIANEFDEMIAKNLSKVQEKADKEFTLENATKSVGIRIQDGTEIEYSDLAGNEKVKINRVTFDNIFIIRDKKGHQIGKRVGPPTIHLSDTKLGKMPFGRFKKWVDSTDAVEKINSTHDVEIATGLYSYDLKIAKGMQITYVQRHTNNEGKVVAVPLSVIIEDIDEKVPGGKITVNPPIMYHPGYPPSAVDFPRESFSFGQFVKWWNRNEVEKAVSLEELRKVLDIYTVRENKTFGIPEKENPPISILLNEKLRYSEEGSPIFTINEVSHDSIYLEHFGKLTFPEFFYWVKNNHVRKVPEIKTREQTEHEEEAKAIADAKKNEEDATQVREKQKAEEKLKEVRENLIDHQSPPPMERLKQLWYQTQFLSFKDLWTMIHTVVEFVKRKHERRSKGRAGTVGRRLPGVLGTEFERERQEAETGEVNKYKEAMEHWGIPEIRQVLHNTSDSDEGKAAILTLVHKGEMRWDDPHFWEMLNRLTSRYTTQGAELYIPPPDKMPPGKSGEDYALKAMDILWGKGTGAELFSEQTSKYNGMKKNFEAKFKQLENDPYGTGGPAGACEKMLYDWRHGEYVSPHEYESMIDQAIYRGKMSGEAKMFYLIAGVIAQQHGESLLHMDRLGEIDSEHLNRFPLLDFFTQFKIYDAEIYDYKEKKFGGMRKLNKREDFVKFMETKFPNDYENGKPGPEFSKFMWETMLMNPVVRTRISKGLRNAEQMDHDDAHLFIPPATVTQIDELTGNISGNKKYFTPEGYMNGYPGFSQYLMSISYAVEEETNDDAKKSHINAMRDGIASFIRFDAILDNRLYRAEGDKRARLSDSQFDNPKGAVVDSSCPIRTHQNQLRNLILEIGSAYGKKFDWLYQSRFRLDQKEEQEKYENQIRALPDVISDIIAADNGAKAVEAIRRARERNYAAANGLGGIPASRRPKPGEGSGGGGD